MLYPRLALFLTFSALVLGACASGPQRTVIEDPKPLSEEEQKAKAKEIVKNAGIEAALGSDLLGAGPLKNIFGDSSGFDAKMNEAMSGVGNELVIGQGAGGMGFRGTGTGGGGAGYGTIGGLGQAKPKPKKVSTSSLSAPSLSGVGKLEGAIVKRVLTLRDRQMRACFDHWAFKQESPKQGDVTLHFTIDPQGKVSQAKAGDTTIDPRVSVCMIDALQNVAFPAPLGGALAVSQTWSFEVTEQ